MVVGSLCFAIKLWWKIPFLVEQVVKSWEVEEDGELIHAKRGAWASLWSWLRRK